jgi:hypothetical protein
MESLATRRVLSLLTTALASLALGTIAQGQSPSRSNPTKKIETPVQVPNDFKFEPPWRQKGDCGALALYVLMRLHNREVTITDVKKFVPFDPQVGCSLADLSRGAEALGFATEIRFVNPQDLHKLPQPFILHTQGSLERGVGHFGVIVDYRLEERKFYLIDTTFDMLGPVPEESILKIFSGYVLIPKNDVDASNTHLLSWVLICLGCILAGFTIFLYPIRKKGLAPGTLALSSEKVGEAKTPCPVD